MTELEQQLLAVQDQALAEIQTINDEQSFEAVRAKYIGRKGSLPALMSKLGTVPPEEKPAVGKTLNAVKNAIQKAFDENSLFTYKGKCRLLVSTLNGSEAAVLGASALGWE